MSVGGLLGLDGDSVLLARARGEWGAWVEAQPRLGVVAGLDELRGWLRSASAGEADEVLLALAMLAAPDGGDEVAAAAVLAKCLLPGACRLAGSLCGLRPRGGFRDSQPVGVAAWLPGARIDELVASQLWIEVRSFPWRRLRKVAANVLMNTRSGVLRELGEHQQLARVDRTWANTVPVPPHPGGWPAEVSGVGHCGVDADAESAGEELAEVLGWAREVGVITGADQRLLLCLVDEARGVETRCMSRGYAGLVSNELSVRVGARLGVSEATVRRRVSRCLRALAAAVAKDLGRVA